MGVDEVHGFFEIDNLGICDGFGDETGGDVEAVEDVFDVVEDVGGDLCLSSHIGGIQHYFMCFIEFFSRFFEFFDGSG